MSANELRRRQWDEYKRLLFLSCDYVECLGYRVSSEAIPDSLLWVWALPLFEDRQTNRILETLSLATPNPRLKYVPLTLFSLVFEKRYGRRPLAGDAEEMLDYYGTFQVLMLHVYLCRRKGFPLFEFDIFDLKRYDEYFARILACAADRGEA